VKIAVCVKQVPQLEDVRFDNRNRIVREDVELMVNPADLGALGCALELREAEGGEVLVLTMGPPPAREVLEDALRRGADRAVHLVDKRFAGADTLATARALTHALEREEADLILFGRSTLDGATAQVGPQVAELLGVPQVTHVISLSVSEGRVRAQRETERGEETWTSSTPVVISIERGADPPEPGAGEDREVEEVTAEELGGTPRDYGTRGSPTFVSEVRETSLEREVERVEDAGEGADRLAALVDDIEHEGGEASHSDDERTRAIWVLAEHDRDRLHPSSLEGIACARDAADELDAEVVAVLFCSDPEGLEQELGAHGADRVVVVRHEALAEYATGPFTDALCAALEEHEPFAVIAPWTARGRDYVPRAAARLGIGLTGDFVRLEVAHDDEEADPDLLWVKPAWAGTVESPIITHRAPAMGTLRPGVFRPLVPRAGGGDVAVDELEPELDPSAALSREDENVSIEAEQLLDNSPVVVCVGDGLDEKGVESARHLAEAMRGSLGATHRAAEAGLVPSQLELSVLKRSMSPLLLVAVGVEEGEDLDAVRSARRVVTVHPDANASVQTRADLAIVAEPQAFLEAALERLGREDTA
jgi:electron transfer flavoprotein alpha subunit